MMQKALYGLNKPVSIYMSNELAEVKAIVNKEEPSIPRDQLFDWEKREDIFIDSESDETKS
jgi:hypothetical protein